jgi:hypothetical protein
MLDDFRRGGCLRCKRSHKGFDMIALVFAAILLCQDCTIVIPPRENPTEKAMREFRERQDRIRPAESELQKAQRRFQEDQQRLLCANHPEQCR